MGVRNAAVDGGHGHWQDAGQGPYVGKIPWIQSRHGTTGVGSN